MKVMMIFLMRMRRRILMMVKVRVIFLSCLRPGRVVAVDAAGDNLAYIRFQSHVFNLFCTSYICVFAYF